MNPDFEPATQEQMLAWSFYGIPSQRGVPASIVGSKTRVGEVRFVIGWMADQMVRMGWRLEINGSPNWTLELPDGTRVSSNTGQSNPAAPDHPVQASAAVLKLIEWDGRTVREVTTNLFVAGELHYALDSTGHWRVVSVIRTGRKEILSRSSIVVRGLWPHPADPAAPDAPLFGVLDTLDDIAWLNRVSRSQSASRVGMRGIIGFADTLATAGGETGEAFWDDLNNAMRRSMDDAEDIGPVGVRGAQELIEPAANGKGMKGLSWVIPEFPYDATVDERIDRKIHRLAYGLPVPPEILLGLQAQSKATAFQVEGSTYRAHIEPAALLVAKIATDTLAKLMPDVGVPEVIPDPTAILARKHSVADVLEAFDRGAVSYAYLLEVLGIPDEAAATEADLAQRERVLGKSVTVDDTSDPADEAASEPLTAAMAASDDERLADMLSRIDDAVFHELTAAITQALHTTRERLGARIRASKNFKPVDPDLGNADLILALGRENVEALLSGAVPGVLGRGFAFVLSWWGDRVDQARDDTAEILAQVGVPISFVPGGVAASVSALEAFLTEAIWSKDSIDAAAIRGVIAMAGS